MPSPSRRTFLRGAGASLVVPALAGCAVDGGSHHQPHLRVENDDDSEHRVSVRVDGPEEVVFDRTLQLDAETDRTFEDRLPAYEPDDAPEIGLTVTVDDRDPHEETRLLGSGAHALWVTVVEEGAVDTTYVVH